MPAGSHLIKESVLIKGGVHVEELAKFKVVALDKTGTITRGEPEVTDVVLSKGRGALRSHSEVLAVAAGMERLSQHPLALAIVRHAEGQRVTPAEVRDFRSLTGAGAWATYNGSTVYVGKPGLFQAPLRVSLDSVRAEIERLQAEGKTVVLIGDQRGVWALVAIRDNIRTNPRQAVQKLHAVAVERVVMLTGDNERTAQAIARAVGIDEIYANLTSEDKARKVQELPQRYGHMATVGDGVNDAPALAEATVGIAMGAAGTDAALETADIALMSDDLFGVPWIVRHSRWTLAVIRQNIGFSLAIKAIFVALTFVEYASLWAAIATDMGASLLVIFNGLRLLNSARSA